MTESESLQRAIEEEVALMPYDRRWPARFIAERERLLERFPAQLLDVQHIGSTAIPGMPAKPVIDIMAGVASMAAADALFTPLLAHGYVTSVEFNATLTDRRWFMRHANGHRTHHLHLVVWGERLWGDRLQFRDALRADPTLARRYAELKRSLVDRHRRDREAYTAAKDDFVRAILHGSPLSSASGSRGD